MPVFSDFLSEQLKLIDQRLAHDSMPIHTRPFWAAVTFVKECIVDIEGASKEDYLNQPWFAGLHHMVEGWYITRYGKERLRQPSHTAAGVVLIFDVPFQIEVPLTILEVVAPGDQGWVHFPTTIHTGENPFDWLVKPPNLDSLSDIQRRSLEKSIRRVALALRRIYNGFVSAESEPDRTGSPLATLLSHLRKAADDICGADASLRSTALWEIHLAVEKTTKAYLRQGNVKVPRTHDLHELYQRAVAAGLAPLPKGIPAGLPTASEAIGHRYGELGTPCLIYTTEALAIALDVIAHFAAAFPRKFYLNDAKFLIRVPPWER